MDIQIIVATHKPYWMPDDAVYLPLHVGKEGKDDIGFTPDNTGDNISHKNASYCELTGLYWAWKNLDADYIGLAHYRRHFGSKTTRGRDKKASVIGGQELRQLLADGTDVIVPKKRKYYIETIYNHYSHTFTAEHLDITRDILAESAPEYLAAFDAVMGRTATHMFNMFIMKKELLDSYCTWLFDVLGQLEGRIDISSMTPFEARVFGRISERLLDVWLLTNYATMKEVPCVHLEKVNWPSKIKSFLQAKFLGKKYRESF